MADDGLAVVTGDLALSGEARLGVDEFVTCPTATEAEAWCQDVLRARRLLKAGVPLDAVVRRPSAAFLDALAFVDVEVEALDARRMDDERKRIEALNSKGAA